MSLKISGCLMQATNGALKLDQSQTKVLLGLIFKDLTQACILDQVTTQPFLLVLLRTV